MVGPSPFALPPPVCRRADNRYSPLARLLCYLQRWTATLYKAETLPRPLPRPCHAPAPKSFTLQSTNNKNFTLFFLSCEKSFSLFLAVFVVLASISRRRFRANARIWRSALLSTFSELSRLVAGFTPSHNEYKTHASKRKSCRNAAPPPPNSRLVRDKGIRPILGRGYAQRANVPFVSDVRSLLSYIVCVLVYSPNRDSHRGRGLAASQGTLYMLW